ncbi:ClbS/DfsB family four-helix bundle protein [Escherichia albertii]
MSVPESKAALLLEMEKSWNGLTKKLSRIPEEKAFLITMEGHASGTVMSAANLVSYLIGWGEQVLTWHRQEEAGIPIDFPAKDHKWNELGKLAQTFYANYSHVTSWSQLCEMLETNHQQLKSLVERYSDNELDHHPWYGKWTRGRMIQFNTVSPYRNASTRLNALLKQF